MLYCQPKGIVLTVDLYSFDKLCCWHIKNNACLWVLCCSCLQRVMYNLLNPRFIAAVDENILKHQHCASSIPHQRAGLHSPSSEAGRSLLWRWPAVSGLPGGSGRLVPDRWGTAVASTTEAGTVAVDWGGAHRPTVLNYCWIMCDQHNQMLCLGKLTIQKGICAKTKLAELLNKQHQQRRNRNNVFLVEFFFLPTVLHFQWLWCVNRCNTKVSFKRRRAGWHVVFTCVPHCSHI